MDKIIMWLMQLELNKIRKKQDTPYIYIRGGGKYLMYTDDAKIAERMHRIY